MQSMDTQSRPPRWHIPGACCNGSDVESMASVALNSSRYLQDVQGFRKAATDRCIKICSQILKVSVHYTMNPNKKFGVVYACNAGLKIFCVIAC